MGRIKLNSSLLSCLIVFHSLRRALSLNPASASLTPQGQQPPRNRQCGTHGTCVLGTPPPQTRNRNQAAIFLQHMFHLRLCTTPVHIRTQYFSGWDTFFLIFIFFPTPACKAKDAFLCFLAPHIFCHLIRLN